jgi:GAF domain-containing protein
MTAPANGRPPPRTQAADGARGHLVLADESVQTVLERVVGLVKRAMPEGCEVSITLVREEQPTTAAFTGALARELDERQYQRGHGPCLDAALGGHVLEIVDARTEGRWPDYVPTSLERGALSSIAVPVHASRLVAGLNVYAPSAHTFTDEDRRALVESASYVSVALSNVESLQDARDLAGNLGRAMASRSVIEQAKGILMERYKLTPDQAFRMLVEASMHTNRKLRDLSESLVLTGSLDV